MANITSANLQTPLLKWMAKYAVIGDLATKGRDFRMGPTASARIAVGISQTTRSPYVALTGDDDIVFSSFDISKIAFARNVNNRDWLVFVTPDASQGRAKTPVPMRIWFPAQEGIFDGWCGTKDQIVQIIHLTEAQVALMPNVSEEDINIIGEAPLTLQGDWTGLEVIADMTPEEVEGLEEPEEVAIETAPVSAPLMEEDEEDVGAEIERLRAASEQEQLEEIEGLDIDSLLNI